MIGHPEVLPVESPAAPLVPDRIVLAHGGGGQLTDDLVGAAVMPRIGNAVLNDLLDAALLPASGDERIAMSIDSYVVQPWQFPGGNIGRLAVSGTINDLAVCGAVPTGLALGLILEEGFRRSDLESVLDAVGETAREAGVHVVTGDTKVVGTGKGDGIYITTAGVGRVSRQCRLSPTGVAPGDVILVNGPIGEHGLAVMLAREMPEVRSILRSDAAPLNGLIAALMHAVPDVRFMRDPTRSGLAGVVVDLARASGHHLVLEEPRIPVQPAARHAADMLGLDPLEIANEGKVVVVVDPDDAEAALTAMRRHPLGAEACVVGYVGSEEDGVCELHTTIGGRRVIQKPYGEQLPRIC